jgi:hypothetical protein
MRRSLPTNANSWPLVAVVLFDVALIVSGNDTISTHVRRHWRARPYVAAAVTGFLLAHFVRPDNYDRYDPLTHCGRLLTRKAKDGTRTELGDRG